MNKKKVAFWVPMTIAALVVIFSACSKKEAQVVSKEPQQASSSSAIPINDPIESLPLGDPNYPIDSYKEILSNNDLMFTYYALSKEQPDYDKITSNYALQYWATNDQFKRRDLVESQKPEIDKEIAARKDARYVKLKVNATWKVQKYDFDKKAFPQVAVTNQSQFGWDAKEWVNRNKIAISYFATFTNGDEFNLLKVEDERVARLIEEKKHEEMSLIVYGFVQGVDPQEPLLKVQVLDVTLINKDGVELLSKRL